MRKLMKVVCVYVVFIVLYLLVTVVTVHFNFPQWNRLNRFTVKSGLVREMQQELQSQVVQGVDCKKITNGDTKEIQLSQKKLPEVVPNDTTVIKHTQNCEIFRQVYGYDVILNTDEERDFPIAFNILFYKEVAQVEMLLRTIYRPQNTFCLHVDGRAPPGVHQAAEALADCFSNVFIVSKTEFIIYESFQRLQADLNCMKDHLDRGSPWDYLINLPGEEYPLKTNLEMVRILKAMKGRNSVECRRVETSRYRYIRQYIYKYYSVANYTIIKTQYMNPPLPHDLHIVKGSAYGIFSRQFIDYVMNNRTAQDLLASIRGVLSPDEYFWSTLHCSPQLNTPGNTAGVDKVLLSTYVAWPPSKCHNKWLRTICVFGSGDVQSLVDQKHLFANKFQLISTSSYVALQCLSEWLHNKTTKTPQRIDTALYTRLTN